MSLSERMRHKNMFGKKSLLKTKEGTQQKKIIRAYFRDKIMWILLFVCLVSVTVSALLWYPPLLQQSYQPESTAPFFEVASDTVNVNTAPMEELSLLPGIGSTKALKIIEYRELHGEFAVLEDLLSVPGIGPETLKDLEPLISF